MQKTNIIYVALSKDQMEEVNKIPKFSRGNMATHGIIWEGRGQIFGTEKLMSKFWYNWTHELTKEEKEKSIDLRSVFLNCIEDNDYEFTSYEQRDFRTEIVEISNRLLKELNDKRMEMVNDEYKEALERVRAGTDQETLNEENTLIKKIGYILIVLIVLASLSTLFNF